MTNTLYLTLCLTTNLPSNQALLSTHNSLARDYMIQSSSNMVDWTTIDLYRDEDVSFPVILTKDCLFYRIKQVGD